MNMKRPRRTFTAEYKAGVVALYRTTEKTVTGIARELDLSASAVQRWVTQAEVDAGQRDGLTTTEREELAALRGENSARSVAHVQSLTAWSRVKSSTILMSTASWFDHTASTAHPFSYESFQLLVREPRALTRGQMLGSS